MIFLHIRLINRKRLSTEMSSSKMTAMTTMTLIPVRYGRTALSRVRVRAVMLWIRILKKERARSRRDMWWEEVIIKLIVVNVIGK